MNEMLRLFPEIIILGFPCNQFGHQENGNGEEIPNGLHYVRPGNEFQTNILLMEKTEVNGKNSHPVYRYLREKLPRPFDNPDSLMTNPQYLIWTPVTRTDLSWNFEKFIIDKAGEPFRRYSPRFPTIDLAPIIESLVIE